MPKRSSKKSAPPDAPFSLFDINWLAVKGGETEPMLEALGLTDPQPVTWPQGIGAVCGDCWDFDANLNAPMSRVYVTPQVAGWRLAIGGWLAMGPAQEESINAYTKIAEYCRRLSAGYGEAHAFMSQGRMDCYGWILARDGRVVRTYVWDGVEDVNEGTPTPPELRMRTATNDGGRSWQPSESAVMAMAAEYSIDPRAFTPETPWSGSGVLAKTEWGRRHGVPARPLEP